MHTRSPSPFFRSANQAQAQIVLGDRPVEVTLKRAWEALSFGERLDLARSLVRLAVQRAGGGGGAEGDEGGTSEAAEVREEFGRDGVAGLDDRLIRRDYLFRARGWALSAAAVYGKRLRPLYIHNSYIFHVCWFCCRGYRR